MTSTSSPPERPARPPRRNAQDATGAKVDQTGVRTHPRWTDRRKSAPLVKVGMILFFVGGLAILADVVLFASGHQDLPLWLNLCALLAPDRLRGGHGRRIPGGQIRRQGVNRPADG